MQSLSFISSPDDHALFVQHTSRESILVLSYVDDMLIIEDDRIGISKLHKYLCQHFEIKDLG